MVVERYAVEAGRGVRGRSRAACRWVASVLVFASLMTGCAGGVSLSDALYRGTLTYISGQVSGAFDLIAAQLTDMVIQGNLPGGGSKS